MIISAYQAKALLASFSSKEKEIDASLDLGITLSKIRIEKDRFVFPDGQTLGISDIKKVIKKDTACFFIEDSTVRPIQLFSETTQKFYKLFPTEKWPSLEISGIRMHVTKAFSPKEDTEKKISFIQPCKGRVLDTCTGLGYTAIMASKTAEEVYTFEIDENVVEIERWNPYSKELFENPKIKRHVGDVFKEIRKFPPGFFDAIIHDPPRLALSTLLYSEEFYGQLYRVLKQKGRIYHYTGDPGNKRGIDIRSGIIKRFERIRFKKIERVFNGISAEK